MKKKLLYILLLTILLTGCSKSTNVLMSYESNESISDKEYELAYQTPEIANTFANNLSVIPLDFNSSKDNLLTATSTLIVNATNNNMLYANNVYKRVYPASITKIATALVTLKYGNLDDLVTISYDAANITEPGAKLCGFHEGDKIKLKDLLTCLLIYSGNDAGVAIAEHIGGSVEGFADMMNKEVKKLGAVDSHFVNPHGLHDDNHYTTAYDLYLIFNKLIKNDIFVDIIDKRGYHAVYQDAKGKKVEKTFETTNRYLKGTANAKKGITVIGGKTGTTSAAGSCLILYSKDEKDNDYISVVMKAVNGGDLFNQMTHLLSLIPEE